MNYDADIHVIALAIEDEYAAIFGKRCSTSEARRLSLRAIQAIHDNARPRFRTILAPWLDGSVTFRAWCDEVDRWFPPALTISGVPKPRQENDSNRGG